MSFNTTEVKSIFLSKTFWGSLLGLISVLFPGLYTHLLAAIGIADPTAISAQIVGGIGAVLAIYGRFVATQPVSLFGSSTASK